MPQWLLDADVSDGAIRLFAALDRFDGTKGCFPSRETLADRLHRSVDTVDDRVKELKEIGAITVTMRWSRHGDRTSNLYKLHRKGPWCCNPTIGGRASSAPKRRDSSATLAGVIRLGDRGTSEWVAEEMPPEGETEEREDIEREPLLSSPAAAEEDVGTTYLRPHVPEGGPSDDPGALRRSLADALQTSCRMEGALTRSERAEFDSLVDQLIVVGASPEDVLRRAGHWAMRFDLPLTPRALVRNWAQLARPSGGRDGWNRKEDPPPVEPQGGGMLDARIAFEGLRR